MRFVMKPYGVKCPAIFFNRMAVQYVFFCPPFFMAESGFSFCIKAFLTAPLYCYSARNSNFFICAAWNRCMFLCICMDKR